jgi:uncharacterized protein with GYD domain
MATYILLSRFTDQGIRNVKDTTKRAEAFKETARKLVRLAHSKSRCRG